MERLSGGCRNAAIAARSQDAVQSQCWAGWPQGCNRCGACAIRPRGAGIARCDRQEQEVVALTVGAAELGWKVRCDCHVVGLRGYGAYRECTQVGRACAAIAASPMPRHPGDRVKRSRRDASALPGVSSLGGPRVGVGSRSQGRGDARPHSPSGGHERDRVSGAAAPGSVPVAPRLDLSSWPKALDAGAVPMAGGAEVRTVPIRLMQTPTTCRMLPLAGI